MSFCVGDIVKIKDNFNNERYDGDPGIDSDMLNFMGTVTKVERVYSPENEGLYILRDNSWIWDGRWLEYVGTPIKPVTEDELFILLGSD